MKGNDFVVIDDHDAIFIVISMKPETTRSWMIHPLDLFSIFREACQVVCVDKEPNVTQGSDLDHAQCVSSSHHKLPNGLKRGSIKDLNHSICPRQCNPFPFSHSGDSDCMWSDFLFVCLFEQVDLFVCSCDQRVMDEV